MTPTEAYRALKERWSGDYTPPQIVDAFIAGGLRAKSRTALLAQLHSVLRRERLKAEKNGNAPQIVTMRDIATALDKNRRLATALSAKNRR